MGGTAPTSEGSELAAASADVDGSAGVPVPPRPQTEGDVPAEPHGGGLPRAWVRLERGTCPICGLEFEDRRLYQAHLGEEHDLHDDEGTESEFGTYVLAPDDEPAPVPALVVDEALQRRQQEPDLGRPTGLIVLIVFLLGLLGGAVVVTRGGDEPASEQAAATSSTTALVTGDKPASAPPTTATGSPPAAPAKAPAAAPVATTQPPAPATAPTTAPAPAPAAAPAPTTTIVAAAPAPGFVPPSATRARITSCERTKDLWRVTYRWLFSGGSLWKPLSSYLPLGGGRYQHVVEVPRRSDAVITRVYVTDPSGAQHIVKLAPALETSSC